MDVNRCNEKKTEKEEKYISISVSNCASKQEEMCGTDVDAGTHTCVRRVCVCVCARGNVCKGEWLCSNQ